MRNKHKFYVMTYLLFLLVSFVLPFYSFEGYSIISNTTSHLAAQASPYAWIMNIVFVLLGLSSVWVSIQSKIRYHQIIGVLFGLSLLMTGIFQHAPLIETVSVNDINDNLHSIFANLTGISFTLLAFGHGFMSAHRQRIIGILMGFISIGLSLAMFSLPMCMGLFQRLMFMSAFAWLFFYMDVPKEKQI